MDNGVGLPATFSMSSEKSLGMFIVGLLIEQIGGKIDIIRKNGTAFHIRFRDANVNKQDITLKLS
jgi:two-component sensor histidine kinase